ncbi:hypothetical protein MLD38_015889 [Melastoma candidum]|uniref:Uncharacterized protein n=1 Tax=Melastoma candidum TaxID=119954 RepID=A0ACB9RIY5_9MYRT|nr:hypothetical protein MLD38_015889 [Melastoma candidum]
MQSPARVEARMHVCGGYGAQAMQETDWYIAKVSTKQRLDLAKKELESIMLLDNFERAKTRIKVESEGEEKINNSYQSIYKQFTEILSSLGVVPVETIGNPFDPLACNRVGSKFSQVVDDITRALAGLCPGFLKTWIRL